MIKRSWVVLLVIALCAAVHAVNVEGPAKVGASVTFSEADVLSSSIFADIDVDRDGTLEVHEVEKVSQ